MTDNIKITVEVNGEQVPLSSISNEIISKIKEQEEAQSDKNAPVFSKVRDRLIVKLTSHVIHTMREAIKRLDCGDSKEGQYMTFNPDGLYGAYNIGRTWKEARTYYPAKGIPKPIF